MREMIVPFMPYRLLVASFAVACAVLGVTRQASGQTFVDSQKAEVRFADTKNEISFAVEWPEAESNPSTPPISASRETEHPSLEPPRVRYGQLNEPPTLASLIDDTQPQQSGNEKGSPFADDPIEPKENPWSHGSEELPIIENGGPADGYYTTGAPIVGDGGFFFDYPEEPVGLHEKILEAVPSALSKVNEPLGNMLSHLVFSERTELETELHDEVLGIQPVPERPPLIVEWNERFLGPGPLNPGFTTATGAVWRPAIWVWGEFQTGINYFDNSMGEPVAEWANRLDLFTQLNLSGTERVVWGVRPLDRETDDGTGRQFAGYDFRDGKTLPGGNFELQTLFFEGDFGEIFPGLDPYDFKALDLGFSVGRMPLLAQQGILLNEDIIDAVTLTRNTLYGHGNLNLRATGVYAWDRLTRNSPIAGNPNRMDNNSQMLALLTESDFAKTTVNADVVYIYGDAVHGDMVAFALSGIQRHHLAHNTYNTSLHYLGSYPVNGRTDYADQGHLLFGQLSWTPHHYYDLIYLNAFLAVDQFTSPARGPAQGGPLGQTGILFAGTGLGRFGAPIPVRTDEMAGASLGYQWFFDETRKQVIWEVGGVAETQGDRDAGQIGTALRYQQAIGQHLIWLIDGFVTKAEGLPTGGGGRTVLRAKF